MSAEVEKRSIVFMDFNELQYLKMLAKAKEHIFKTGPDDLNGRLDKFVDEVPEIEFQHFDR